MAHVFISYAHVDFEFAENLKHRLEKAGFDVWLDEERLRVGEDWREDIDAAIRDSFALIVVITPEAMTSKYVTYEWAFAWGAQKKVIPLLLRNPTDSNIAVHPRLDKRQYLDFSDRQARRWDKLFEALQSIKDILTTNISADSDIPPAIQKAISALDSHIPSERKNALFSLLQTNHPATITALVNALEHPFSDIRIHAAIGLVDLNQRSITSIDSVLVDAIRAWHKVDPEIAKSAVRVLGAIGELRKIEAHVQGK